MIFSEQKDVSNFFFFKSVILPFFFSHFKCENIFHCFISELRSWNWRIVRPDLSLTSGRGLDCQVGPHLPLSPHTFLCSIYLSSPRIFITFHTCPMTNKINQLVNNCGHLLGQEKI